jgi:hypothetical protein
MGIFAAFYAKELEPGMRILLAPLGGRPGSAAEVRSVDYAPASDIVAVRHDLGVHLCRASDLIQIEVVR